MAIEEEHHAEGPSTQITDEEAMLVIPGSFRPRELSLSSDGSGVVLNVAPSDFELTSHTCRVWSLPLGGLLGTASKLEHLESLLSEEERARARAFRVPIPRAQFIVCRAVLRLLLACYSGSMPQDLRFGYLEFGKPYLESPAIDLSFNVAHSVERALFAFGRGLDVGVDIEAHRPLRDLNNFASSVLGPHDLATWLGLPEEQRVGAMYTAWVRKEAVMKSIGKGLTLGLPEVEVTFLPEQNAEVRAMPNLYGPAERWRLFPLDVGPGYSAALAAPALGSGII